MNGIRESRIDSKKRPKIWLWPLVFLVLYIIFLLGRSVWQHYQINLEIRNLKLEITALQDKNKTLEEQIKYYQTSAYKEKEARAKLGYVKPGEKAIAIPQEKKAPPTNQSQIQTQIYSDEIFKIPNYLKWWDFLFVD